MGVRGSTTKQFSVGWQPVCASSPLCPLTAPWQAQSPHPVTLRLALLQTALAYLAQSSVASPPDHTGMPTVAAGRMGTLGDGGLVVPSAPFSPQGLASQLPLHHRTALRKVSLVFPDLTGVYFPISKIWFGLEATWTAHGACPSSDLCASYGNSGKYPGFSAASRGHRRLAWGHPHPRSQPHTVFSDSVGLGQSREDSAFRNLQTGNKSLGIMSSLCVPLYELQAPRGRVSIFRKSDCLPKGACWGKPHAAGFALRKQESQAALPTPLVVLSTSLPPPTATWHLWSSALSLGHSPGTARRMLLNTSAYVTEKLDFDHSPELLGLLNHHDSLVRPRGTSYSEPLEEGQPFSTFKVPVSLSEGLIFEI